MHKYDPFFENMSGDELERTAAQGLLPAHYYPRLARVMQSSALSELEDVNAALSTARADLDAVQRQKDDLEARLWETQAALKTAEADLKSAREAADTAQRQLDELERVCRQLCAMGAPSGARSAPPDWLVLLALVALALLPAYLLSAN